MSEKKFFDFPPIHLDPEMINRISSGNLDDLPESVAELESAKIEVIKRVWEKLFLDSPILLRAICDISDDHRMTVIRACREGLLTGLVFGYALGCNYPYTEQSSLKFDEAVKKLMDRRQNGCDDPNCFACQIKRAMSGKREKKTEEPTVM